MKLRVVPLDPHRDMIEAAYPMLPDMPPKRAKDLCRDIYREMILHAPEPQRGRLTVNQRRVLEIVADQIDQTGICPTVREIAALLGFTSHKSAWRALRSLKRKGVVTIGPGHRDVQLLLRPEEI